MKSRLFRLLIVACIAVASLSATLVISSGPSSDTRVARSGK